MKLICCGQKRWCGNYYKSLFYVRLSIEQPQHIMDWYRISFYLSYALDWRENGIISKLLTIMLRWYLLDGNKTRWFRYCQCFVFHHPSMSMNLPRVILSSQQQDMVTTVPTSFSSDANKFPHVYLLSNKNTQSIILWISISHCGFDLYFLYWYIWIRFLFLFNDETS